MRSGDRVLIEDFAVGGTAAMESVAVPGGESFGAISRIVFRGVGAASDDVRLADAVHAATPGYGIAQIDDAWARGHTINGVDATGEFVGRAAAGDGEQRNRGKRGAQKCPPRPGVCR